MWEEMSYWRQNQLRRTKFQNKKRTNWPETLMLTMLQRNRKVGVNATER